MHWFVENIKSHYTLGKRVFMCIANGNENIISKIQEIMYNMNSHHITYNTTKSPLCVYGYI